ncbi:unnamed protein product [Linum trigynum]|uniref:Transmembrane protein n=1 Tax=Linum trigynum TaxID=586398 RepID=A0AAV2FUL9_9ROSI
MILRTTFFPYSAIDESLRLLLLVLRDRQDVGRSLLRCGEDFVIRDTSGGEFRRRDKVLEVVLFSWILIHLVAAINVLRRYLGGFHECAPTSES